MEQTNLFFQLNEKMKAEQEQYRSDLLTKTPQEILDHAFEYIIREDILCAVEDCGELTAPQMIALLKSPSPLTAVYQAFMKCETDHMDVLRDCILNEAEKQAEYQPPVSALQAKLAEAKAAIQNNLPLQMAKQKSQAQEL